MGSGGGYYNELDDDDYSSYGLDVYASSSSNPSLLASGGGSAEGSAETADGSSNRATIDASGQSARGDARGRRQGASQQPSSVFDLLNTVNRGGQWPITDDGSQTDAWQQAAATANGDLFDLVTGGDQSSTGSSVTVTGSSDRASERHILAPARADRRDPLASSSAGSRQASGPGSSSSVEGLNNRPSVPTSTTTPAPEFVMINPMTSQT